LESIGQGSFTRCELAGKGEVIEALKVRHDAEANDGLLDRSAAAFRSIRSSSIGFELDKQLLGRLLAVAVATLKSDHL
jgi:hypothetical protein